MTGARLSRAVHRVGLGRYTRTMHALCIQPPLVQLNAPYPAVWYIDTWLRDRGITSSAIDHSIELAHAVFCRKGLETVFSAAKIALKGRKHPDDETARRIQNYFDDEPLYLAMIDSMMAFLEGGDPAFAHRLAVGAGMPAGMRSEAVFGDGMGSENARAFATATLSDLSDFISYALDADFGVVRYAERLSQSAPAFAPILDAAQNGWVIKTLYRPLLRRLFDSLKQERSSKAVDGEQLLLLLSIPFPGCLAGAIAAAAEARLVFGRRVTIVAGGGYISTELRFLEEPSIFNIFDYLAYDAGFGALASILDVLGGGPKNALFHVRYRDETGKVIASGFQDTETRIAADTQNSEGRAADTPGFTEYSSLESEDISRIHPDYYGLDFSRYLRLFDSPNPMQRLWNDTPWLKYRLAYGCYWHRCAFCDTQLDYIKRYKASDLDRLISAALSAAQRSGLYGIHFVDEAMPVNMVRAFAARNAEFARPFTFWGNVRFDKAWTDEACAFTAERGLVAVSGGIEIATRKGLQIVDKGFSMVDLVRTLASFKKTGILIHAYLIYGFPGQADQDIADSAEMARVLLAEGLVDSAFWHKFVLTRHSAMYTAWERGQRPELEPIPPVSNFAVNDLSFKGERQSDRWSLPLDNAMSAWADDGETDRPLSSFLAGKLPKPRIDALSILREAGLG
ncbi:radical SAM protein [Spirochaetota bacterium]